MSIDMAGQVRAYAEFLDSTLPVLVDETITEPVGPEPLHPLRVKEPRPRRAGQRRPPRWVYAVTAAVAQGRADWGVAIETVASAHGLGFRPLKEERYDFLVPDARKDRPAVRAFLEILGSEEAREGLVALGLHP